MARQARITLNSREMVLEVKLALEIGVNEALMLRQFYWRVLTYEDDKIADKRHEDLYWLQGTVAEIQEVHFPFWSHNTIRRTLDRLEQQGYLLVERSPNGSKSGDRYTINKEKIKEIADLVECTRRRKRDAAQSVDPTQNEQGYPTQNEQGYPTQNEQGDPTQNEQGSALDPTQFGRGTLPKLGGVPLLIRNQDSVLDSKTHAADRDEPQNAAAAAADSRTSCSVSASIPTLIMSLGIDADTAQALADAPDADLQNIRHQIAAWPLQNKVGLTNPIGYLIVSIRKKRALPPAYLKQLEAEAASQRRREDAARKQADGAKLTEALQLEQTDLNARLKALEANLDPLERAGLEAQARHKLPSIWRTKYDQAIEQNEQRGPLLEQQWRDVWREVLLKRANNIPVTKDDYPDIGEEELDEWP